ncbi:DUF6603 domain-containing protein [Streptomyces goshikiensis]|uniref:DUF6603 domain-containing protein n=1 Tax=Streptomyces goshikiensis TaxID=1942 RepID=UPI0033C3D2A4
MDDVRILLDQATGGAVEIPVSVFADPDAASLVFPDGIMRIDRAVAGAQALSVGGQARITASMAPVDVVFTADGERVTGTVATVDLGEGRSLVLVDGTPKGTSLPAGAWALTGGRTFRLTRRSPTPAEVDPERVDGLGRALPAPRHVDGAVRDRAPRALVTEHGILTPRPGPHRRKGVRILDSPTTRGWSPIGGSDGEFGLSVDYHNPPLRIAGGLATMPASPPYKTVAGGVLLVDTGSFSGSAVGAYLTPDGNGAEPSLFAYGSLGSETGFGPPLFQVRGISAGFGWNSRVRLPDIDALDSFPFLRALANPSEIGAGGDVVDPLEVLRELTGGGDDAWVRPQEGDLWFAAGLAFDCFETLRGHAMALVQTGSDLTISLLGVAGMQLPTKGDKKIARLEIGIDATFRPAAGELSIHAAFTENTYLIDPNCKLRGGAGLKLWFGNSPHAGDFAYMVGAVPAGRQLPAHYPTLPPAELSWGVGSTVNITGTSYTVLTPRAMMSGGSLDVVFQSGMLRAWLKARVDALLEWNPFYFDVGMGVRVGVSATIKVWFVRVRISVEVGVSMRLWGPAVGGEARIHLWFVSFTIGFGAARRDQTPALDWSGFKDMLPAPQTMVRTTAIAGYEGEGAPDEAGGIKPWLASSGGLTFTADTQAPLSKIHLNQGADTVEAADGTAVDILPMHLRGKDSELRIQLTYNGQPASLTEWGRAVLKGNVPNGLWGQRADASGDGIIRDRLLGIRLTSPPVDHGTSTGFLDEHAISFDPITPDGNQPLSAGEPATGPLPTRPGGVIAAIQDGIDTTATRAARTALAQALAGLGADLGDLDTDLHRYAHAAGTAFTAEPMLVAG